MKNIRLILLCTLLLSPSWAQTQDTPKVKVTNVRRAFHNGEHNAFPDLIKWKGKFWLTFRSCPDGHMVFPTSRIIVLSSTDAKEWKEEYHFSVLRSKAPYQKWERKDFPFYIGGPIIKKWGERYFVGGRRNSKEGAKTGLFWLVGDDLKSFAILPSGGDNSYPGFVALDDKYGIVSWYSSHEKDKDGKTITAIYMADLEIAE